MPKRKTFFALAKSWAVKRGLFGPQAFFRYVVFTYVECLAAQSNDFICKGGNLLWMYIHTPRQTIDLDLVTRKANTATQVKSLLASACRRGKDRGVSFKLISFKEVSQQGQKGAAATVEYQTEDGAANTFELDIVYILFTDWKPIPSPIDSAVKIFGATLESIIVDKISTCHRFRGGNTRMKDYDDLWRISQADQMIDWTKVKQFLSRAKEAPYLNKEWINKETTASWERHAKKYQDLPRTLEEVLSAVNFWLKHGLD